MKDPIYFRRFDYDRRLIPNEHLRTLELGVADLDRAQERTGWTVGYPGWGLLYYVLLSHLSWDRANTIIETGTNWGASTIVLAQALVDAGVEGHVHTFELRPEFAMIARDNLDKAGLGKHVTIHVGNSLERLPRVLEDLRAVRVAFLDGSHEHDDVMMEFETILTKLEPNGFVMFDNTYPLTDPSKGEPARVAAALETIKARHGGNIVNFESVSWYTPGMAIWQPKFQA